MSCRQPASQFREAILPPRSKHEVCSTRRQFFGESHTNSGASSGNQRPLPSPVFHPVLLDCLLVLIPDGWQSSILSGHAPDHRPVLVLIAAR